MSDRLKILMLSLTPWHCSQDGHTPLHASVKKGDSKTVDFLVAAGADIASEDTVCGE